MAVNNSSVMREMDESLESLDSDGINGETFDVSSLSTASEQKVDRYGFMGGKQYDANSEANVSVDVIRRRERKWLHMLENWDGYMCKKYKKVRERCRKGIPASIRPRAWQYLCGAKYMMAMNPNKFQKLASQPGNPKWVDDIEKDLDRQFPFHEMFAARGGHGQEDLFRVLKAYSIHNPVDGYCQAMAPIAAVLLMHMPAEQAFWCLVSICDKYVPGYFSTGLEQIQVDGDILFGLLKIVAPLTSKHLKNLRIEPILVMTEWFMCIFSRTLPWASVLRVWDMFFCEGVKVMFRVGLVLLKSTLGRPDQLRQCLDIDETLQRLRNLELDIMQEDFLVYESLRLKITERDMEKEHQLQVAKRRLMQEREKGSYTTAVDSAPNAVTSAPRGKPPISPLKLNKSPNKKPQKPSMFSSLKGKTSPVKLTKFGTTPTRSTTAISPSTSSANSGESPVKSAKMSVDDSGSNPASPDSEFRPATFPRRLTTSPTAQTTSPVISPNLPVHCVTGSSSDLLLHQSTSSIGSMGSHSPLNTVISPVKPTKVASIRAISPAGSLSPVENVTTGFVSAASSTKSPGKAQSNRGSHSHIVAGARPLSSASSSSDKMFDPTSLSWKNHSPDRSASRPKNSGISIVRASNSPFREVSPKRSPDFRRNREGSSSTDEEYPKSVGMTIVRTTHPVPYAARESPLNRGASPANSAGSPICRGVSPVISSVSPPNRVLSPVNASNYPLNTEVPLRRASSSPFQESSPVRSCDSYRLRHSNVRISREGLLPARPPDMSQHDVYDVPSANHTEIHSDLTPQSTSTKNTESRAEIAHRSVKSYPSPDTFHSPASINSSNPGQGLTQPTNTGVKVWTTKFSSNREASPVRSLNSQHSSSLSSVSSSFSSSSSPSSIRFVPAASLEKIDDSDQNNDSVCVNPEKNMPDSVHSNSPVDSVPSAKVEQTEVTCITSDPIMIAKSTSKESKKRASSTEDSFVVDISLVKTEPLTDVKGRNEDISVKKTSISYSPGTKSPESSKKEQSSVGKEDNLASVENLPSHVSSLDYKVMKSATAPVKVSPVDSDVPFADDDFVDLDEVVAPVARKPVFDDVSQTDSTCNNVDVVVPPECVNYVSAYSLNMASTSMGETSGEAHRVVKAQVDAENGIQAEPEVDVFKELDKLAEKLVIHEEALDSVDKLVSETRLNDGSVDFTSDCIPLTGKEHFKMENDVNVPIHKEDSSSKDKRVQKNVGGLGAEERTTTAKNQLEAVAVGDVSSSKPSVGTKNSRNVSRSGKVVSPLHSPEATSPVKSSSDGRKKVPPKPARVSKSETIIQTQSSNIVRGKAKVVSTENAVKPAGRANKAPILTTESSAGLKKRAKPRLQLVNEPAVKPVSMVNKGPPGRSKPVKSNIGVKPGQDLDLGKAVRSPTKSSNPVSVPVEGGYKPKVAAKPKLSVKPDVPVKPKIPLKKRQVTQS